MSTFELEKATPTGLAGQPGDPETLQCADIDACWNLVGVHGNGSCMQLQKFIRCRNCPVYSNAAIRLLDRPMLPAYRHERTQQFAQPRQKGAPVRASALVFRIAAEWFALRTEAFQEVAEHRPVHSLPHRRGGVVLGIVNIRGELLICVSLGHLLGLEDASSAQTMRRTYERLLVTGWNGSRLVFPADEVLGIHRFQLSDLKEPPATVAKWSLNYTHGLLWAGRNVGLLDADRLFASLNRSLT